MFIENEKLEEAKDVLLKMAKGIDPLTGELVGEDSFLNDPRIIRSFYFVTETLTNIRNGSFGRSSFRLAEFAITSEEKERVVLPEGRIGVNEFSRCVNEVIDISKIRKLTGVELNKRLRKLGILGEAGTPDDKTRTVTNENSGEYGFEMEKRTFKGNEYDMVVINDKGKRYLLDNLDTIMKIAV